MKINLCSTFSTLRPHFDALARVGYFKIVLRDRTGTQRALQYALRVFMWSLVLSYNLQHLIKVIQVRHSTDQLVDTLFILLTTLNTLGKQVAFNVRCGHVDNIIRITNGPLFSATKLYHVDLIKSEALLMSRLLKLYHGAVFFCGILWSVYPVVNRALDQPDNFTGFIPFDTTPTVAFALAHAYMSVAITLQAYGNVTMDCTIVGFYSQAKTQIQMLRHNLEQLVDGVKINGRLIVEDNKQTVYRDNGDETTLLQRRFVRCVEHYKQIIGYVKEVESTFGEAMVVQFLVMAWVICMTVYKMVGLSITSAEFVPMTVYLSCMLAQLFIYCYFGTQLKYESELVTQSIYSSDWLVLSPQFRRQLLVMMQVSSRPLLPRIAYVVPMSLETYIAVLKSSYTLFTFLDHN
uniref:Odorant receptor n=1 Tax=Semiothisa cinerearia TaxID=2249628 RepID=A0A889XLA4_9NEOP|nr:odorant receptor [Semiothisa cinerearia]